MKTKNFFIKDKTGRGYTCYLTEDDLIKKFDDETNWNYLFMNQDSVAAFLAKQMSISKGEYLDRDAQGSMAVKMAKGETLIINETKQWL